MELGNESGREERWCFNHSLSGFGFFMIVFKFKRSGFGVPWFSVNELGLQLHLEFNVNRLSS